MAASTASISLKSKQSQAIEDSGWGRKVRLIQPKNFTFWVTSFLLFGGAFLAVIEVKPAIANYASSVATGTIYFGILGAIILWIILRLDRYAKLPFKVKLATILLGGLVSTFALAKLYNDSLLGILTKTQGSDFVHDWGPGVVAPISEEVAKLVPLILMIGLVPRIVKSAYNGMIIGMLSGLAFQIFEDVTYVYNAVAHAFGDAAAGGLVLFMRTAFGITGHWMWTGIAAAGLIYLVGRRPTEPPRRFLGITLIIIPMLLHGAWDAAAALSGGSVPLLFVFYAMLGVITIVVLVKTYRLAVKNEKQWMREILAPEVASGVLNKQELEAVVGRRKPRRKYVKAQKGFMAERRTKHMLEAIHDLADQIAADKAQDTKEVQRCRKEIARIRAKLPAPGY